MTSRREFLQVGLTAAALPLTLPAETAFASPAPAPAAPLYKVLYDTRFPASVVFARRAETRGLATESMDGDMTRFWYDDLYHRWRQGPAAIAGLTAYGALFCLERLAWDQRMRVVFRGEHALASGGCVAHRFEGPAAVLPAAASAAANAAWAAALADVVAECPRGQAALHSRSALTANAATVPAAETLFSWLIAPVPRA